MDYDKDVIFDLDDVTRVKIDDGRIQAIEKNLGDWDAGDVGVMLCTSGLYEGLERAAARNEHGPFRRAQGTGGRRPGENRRCDWNVMARRGHAPTHCVKPNDV